MGCELIITSVGSISLVTRQHPAFEERYFANIQ